MTRYDREDTTVYKVVVNHEEQYSIWPAHRENPLGWRDAGKTGLKPCEFRKLLPLDQRIIPEKIAGIFINRLTRVNLSILLFLFCQRWGVFCFAC